MILSEKFLGMYLARKTMDKNASPKKIRLFLPVSSGQKPVSEFPKSAKASESELQLGPMTLDATGETRQFQQLTASSKTNSVRLLYLFKHPARLSVRLRPLNTPINIVWHNISRHD